MEVIASVLLEGLHCHILSSAIVGRVVYVQHHFPKMPLRKEMGYLTCLKSQENQHSTQVGIWTPERQKKKKKTQTNYDLYSKPMIFNTILGRSKLTSPKSRIFFRCRLRKMLGSLSGSASQSEEMSGSVIN